MIRHPDCPTCGQPAGQAAAGCDHASHSCRHIDVRLPLEVRIVAPLGEAINHLWPESTIEMVDGYMRFHINGARKALPIDPVKEVQRIMEMEERVFELENELEKIDDHLGGTL